MTSMAVIGGGLVGCLAAITLKRRGLDVTVYERHRDLRTFEPRTRPSVNLTLCERGLRPLRRAGLLPAIEPILAPAYERIVHCDGGAVLHQAYGSRGEALYSVERNRLNAILLDAVEADGIAVEFAAECLDIDVAAGDVTLATSAGTRRVRAGCIIGADGTFSAVRSRLQRADRFDYSQQFYEQGYKELRVPAGPGGRPVLEPGALHMWPRRQFVTIAFPNPDQSFSYFVQLPFEGPISFDSLDEPDAVRAFFGTAFPDLPLTVDAVSRFVAQRPNAMVTIRCRPWSLGGRVLLIGDAAHAILPSYGQGANAGFEDCAILGDLIDTYGCDWRRVFSEFERCRKTDTDAIAALCEAHFATVREAIADPEFQRRHCVERRLHELCPERFVPLYSMIAFSSLPYAEAVRRDRLQRALLERVLRGEGLAHVLDNPDLTSRPIGAVLDEAGTVTA